MCVMPTVCVIDHLLARVFDVRNNFRCLLPIICICIIITFIIVIITKPIRDIRIISPNNFLCNFNNFVAISM